MILTEALKTAHLRFTVKLPMTTHVRPILNSHSRNPCCTTSTYSATWAGTAPRQAPAYITRKIPWYAFVEDDALEAIERQTDKLLQEVGVEFRDDPAALERWREADADVIRS